jgi:hypothetical protein
MFRFSSVASSSPTASVNSSSSKFSLISKYQGGSASCILLLGRIPKRRCQSLRLRLTSTQHSVKMLSWKGKSRASDDRVPVPDDSTFIITVVVGGKYPPSDLRASNCLKTFNFSPTVTVHLFRSCSPFYGIGLTIEYVEKRRKRDRGFLFPRFTLRGSQTRNRATAS